MLQVGVGGCWRWEVDGGLSVAVAVEIGNGLVCGVLVGGVCEFQVEVGFSRGNGMLFPATMSSPMIGLFEAISAAPDKNNLNMSN